jgi:hypothetical protein
MLKGGGSVVRVKCWVLWGEEGVSVVLRREISLAKSETSLAKSERECLKFCWECNIWLRRDPISAVEVGV